MQTDQKWLTRKQAAQRAQVSSRTISNWITSGRLKAAKLGRLVRIDSADVDSVLDACKGKAVADAR